MKTPVFRDIMQLSRARGHFLFCQQTTAIHGMSEPLDKVLANMDGGFLEAEMAYSKVKYGKIKCGFCGDIFTPARPHQKFCSLKCRQSLQYKQFSAQTGSPPRTEIPTGTTGAMHELLVCVDLMKKGYHVFRSQSPSCPCDIISMRNGVLQKVEVTTGYKQLEGGYSYPKKSSRYDYDVIAVVFHDGSIVYLASEQEYKT